MGDPSLPPDIRWALMTLGLSAADRPDERAARKAYRKYARQVHPDQGGDPVMASKWLDDLDRARAILIAAL